ncbi:unnamed protein product [Zymoseptoria tritici ST99CH_1A5]|uniref:Uncharacterized protein n=1 Tax=Zymoseptoria tritici ST99CH_1A5 TaxID=1276529 RepID=A0A1Y6LME9_ZYMTR|nr:unnamed protein product [Zymoseptoria tritici ST99CH_3D1]SMY25596.1 unnamed protein product [Zymoseptoria tritici ST99CH_1A5]
MSSSIAIPPRRQQPHSVPSSSSPNSASPSSFASAMSSTSMSPPRWKGKQRATEPGSFSSSPLSSSAASSLSARRPSLMGSSLAKSEYTVINLGHEGGAPRLVTCVKSSQGFDWNQELFLPSYADYDSNDLEHRPDPIEEIVLTDEEAAAMMPR